MKPLYALLGIVDWAREKIHDWWTKPERLVEQALDPPARFKTFSDGQVGEDITDLDEGDINQLRRVYGSSPFLTDEHLQRWAREIQQKRAEQAELSARIAKLPKPVEIVDDGYRPVSGPSAGTSPKTGIVMPSGVADAASKEWADLMLERAYGTGNTARMPGVSQGFSMRYLHELRQKVQLRTATPYELTILRSRGLV